jgi:membrane-bound metal-dependent hydrolase YbcI (DUF457 family)
MPFTPFHFGIHGFFGLKFGRWLDLPVLVLANVIIDVEVLFAKGWPVHQLWHWHTFLGGAIVGAIFGLAMWFSKPILAIIMKLLRLEYKPTLVKMIISGILGAWVHVLVDSFYHYDVQPFWPSKAIPFWNMLHESHASKDAVQNEIRIICVAFWVIAAILYFWQAGHYGEKVDVIERKQPKE